MGDSTNKYNYDEDKNIIEFELPSYSEVMVLSPDGKRVFSSDSRRNAYVSDAESGNLVTTLDWNSEPMMNAAFSPNNTHVAAGSYNSLFRVWSANHGNVICDFKYPELGKAHSLAWSPNGTNLACAFSRSICVVDIYEKAIIAVLSPSKISTLYAVTWSFDGNRVLSGSDDAVCVWNLERAFENSRTWVGTDKNYMRLQSDLTIDTTYWVATSVAFSPDGLLIAFGTGRGEVCIVKPSGTYMEILNIDKFAMPNGHTNKRSEYNLVTSLYFSPDGKSIVSAAKDKSICVWDVDTRTCVKIINIPEPQTNKISFCIFENIGNRFGEGNYREIIIVASKIDWRNGAFFRNTHSKCVIRRWTRIDEKYNLLKFASEGNPDVMSKRNLDLLNKLHTKKTAGETLSPTEQKIHKSLLKQYDFSRIMHSDFLRRNTLKYLNGEEPTNEEKDLVFNTQPPSMGYFPDEDNIAAAPLVENSKCFGLRCKNQTLAPRQNPVSKQNAGRKTRRRKRNKTKKKKHKRVKTNKL